MIKKTKLYAVMGISLIVNAVVCMTVFFATYRERKSLASAFWAFSVSFGTLGASLLALYASKENIRIKDLKKAISEKDHWFHSFEYPECREPKIKVDHTYIPPVETEEE